jgi:hypothetical protein
MAAGRWSTAAPSCECAVEFGMLYLDWIVYVSLGLCGLEEKDGLWKVGDFNVWRKFWDLESATWGSPD